MCLCRAGVKSLWYQRGMFVSFGMCNVGVFSHIAVVCISVFEYLSRLLHRNLAQESRESWNQTSLHAQDRKCTDPWIDLCVGLRILKVLGIRKSDEVTCCQYEIKVKMLTQVYKSAGGMLRGLTCFREESHGMRRPNLLSGQVSFNICVRARVCDVRKWVCRPSNMCWPCVEQARAARNAGDEDGAEDLERLVAALQAEEEFSEEYKAGIAPQVLTVSISYKISTWRGAILLCFDFIKSWVEEFECMRTCFNCTFQTFIIGHDDRLRARSFWGAKVEYSDHAHISQNYETCAE